MPRSDYSEGEYRILVRDCGKLRREATAPSKRHGWNLVIAQGGLETALATGRDSDFQGQARTERFKLA